MNKNKAKILIVDDVPSNISALAECLFDEYQLLISTNGADALKKAKDSPPDLVLLDVIMPEMDGYEVCKRLRAEPKTQNVPILFVSANTDVEDKVAGYRAGADDYITKPYDFREIKEKIVRALDKEKQVVQLIDQVNSAEDLSIQMTHTTSYMVSVLHLLEKILKCSCFDQMIDHLFAITREYGIPCTLQLRIGQQVITRADDGATRKLEEALIDKTKDQNGIFLFGEQRAIYHGENASLLVRDIKDNADNIVYIMHVIEAGIKAIGTRTEVIDKLTVSVDNYRQKNDALKLTILELFESMESKLHNEFMRMAVESNLEENDEKLIFAIIEQERQNADALLSQSHLLDKDLNDVIETMRNTDTEKAAEEVEDDVCFF